MKLIGCDAVDFQGLDSILGSRKSWASPASSAQPQEPIYVHVRIRRYSGDLPEMLPVRTGRSSLDRLPVGTTLDCYV